MIIFCDFDGTITNYDTLDYIIKKHYGEKHFKLLENDVIKSAENLYISDTLSTVDAKCAFVKIEHNLQLRNTLKDMQCSIESILNFLINSPDVKIDPSFIDFYKTCVQSNIEFYILSSGFKKIIKHYLPFIPEENIIANDFDKFLDVSPDYPTGSQVPRALLRNALATEATTDVAGPHYMRTGASINGVDGATINKLSIVKKLSIGKKYIYFGDGVSDFEVIQGDTKGIIYVKKDSILNNLCISKNIKHTPFSNFSDIKILNHLKLLSPGVVKLHNTTSEKLSIQHTFMHRNESFHALYTDVSCKLKNLITDNINDYTTLLVTGSGTTSMDEVINAFVDENILILSNGMFGERWIEIASFYNKNNLFTITKDWGEVFNLDEIKESIITNKIKTVVVVHCDTSIGVLNNVHAIGCLIQATNCRFIVDAVSTFGGIPINMCNSHIDILVTNPNKALASSMGIGIIIGRNSTLNKLKDNNRSYSLNLKRHYTYALKKETCNTCSIPCINALLHSLNMAYKCKNDVIKHHSLYKELYHILYTGIKYKKLLSYNIASPCIITILHENSAQIITYLFNNGYVVYPCKGHLLNSGFQISLYGFDGNKNNIINIVKLINEYS